MKPTFFRGSFSPTSRFFEIWLRALAAMLDGTPLPWAASAQPLETIYEHHIEHARNCTCDTHGVYAQKRASGLCGDVRALWWVA